MIVSSNKVVTAALIAAAAGCLIIPGIDAAAAFVRSPVEKASSSTFQQKQHKTILKAKTSTADARTKRIPNLVDDWAKEVGIQLSGIAVKSSGDSGLGVSATRSLSAGDLVLTVPSNVALSIETPGDGPDDRKVSKLVDRRVLRDLPWFVQFAIYLFKLDQVDSTKTDKSIEMRPWLDSLPRSFDTPIHWTTEQRAELQYNYITKSVTAQEDKWKQLYQTVKSAGTGTGEIGKMTWDDFLWGCECARSRAFSGAYTGSAFNPLPFALTLVLVAAYVGLNLGTVEQAANGAALVFCASILKDFVFPKLSKKKRYIICPVMDMANHRGIGQTGEVSFEFFGDAYSLAMSSTVDNDSELYISYGSRSNDQLLQYYGFVEADNPHDIYVMPPLREWDIGALEEACGKPFASGRLQKLDRAGLLGGTGNNNEAFGGDDDNEAANTAGGVVVTRTAGVDPAIMQALRALVSTEAEWEAAGEAIGNFVEEFSAGNENERLARLAAKTAIEMELKSKPTTLPEDQELLKKMETMKSIDATIEEKIALVFRIEKKKLLMETIEKLR